MGKIKWSLAILFIISFFSPVSSSAQETREQLLESALLNRYYPWLFDTVNNQFECDSIIAIKRLGEENEIVPQFEVIVQLITFQGAHNPPHDLVTITLEDTLTEVKIINVERKQNVPPKDAWKACEQWRKKVDAYFNR